MNFYLDIYAGVERKPEIKILDKNNPYLDYKVINTQYYRNQKK